MVLANVRVINRPLPELLELQHDFEFAEFLTDIGTPPAIIERELAKLRAQRLHDQDA